MALAELKERLDEYIDRVLEGDTVLVTVGDNLVARFTPAGQPPSLDAKLRDLAAAGKIEWGGRRLVVTRPRGKLIGSKTVADLLIEDRGWTATSTPLPS